MIINNYIDNHITEALDRDRTRNDLEAIMAERELKDTFAHKMIRKFLPRHIKCLDTLKPQTLRKQILVALEQVQFVFESFLTLKPLLKQVMND
jgi:hypothetical protein